MHKKLFKKKCFLLDLSFLDVGASDRVSPSDSIELRDPKFEL